MYHIVCLRHWLVKFIITFLTFYRCASNIREVTDTCLSGLVSLLSNRDGKLKDAYVTLIMKCEKYLGGLMHESLYISLIAEMV